MPNKARPHNDNKEVLCMPCMKKCLRHLTEAQVEKIFQAYDIGINVSDARAPQAICEACPSTLCKNDEGKDVT